MPLPRQRHILEAGLVTRRLIAVVLLAFCAGCADPKSIKVTDANKDDFVSLVKDARGLTGDEMRLLMAYQVRHGAAKAIGGTPEAVVGKSVGDLIDAQRKFEADAQAKEKEAERLAAEAKAKEDAKAAELSKSITFTVFDKGFIPKNIYADRYDDYITVKCAYENKSAKSIRAFTGRVEFTDLFGKPIFSSNVTINEPVKAGEKGTWSGSIKYNEFVDEHKALANAELKDMKVRWLPSAIIFEDGTSIGEVAK